MFQCQQQAQAEALKYAYDNVVSEAKSCRNRRTSFVALPGFERQKQASGTNKRAQHESSNSKTGTVNHASKKRPVSTGTHNSRQPWRIFELETETQPSSLAWGLRFRDRDISPQSAL